MTKRIVLCADDYGQAPAISQGILALIKEGRLSATSCMVNTAYWPSHAKWLIPYQAQIDIGLHFNLTEGKAISRAYIDAYGENFFPLSSLLRKAFTHQLDKRVLEAECQAQIDRFAEYLGFLPRFIDGHQHVHQFPVIRDALMNVYEQSLRSQKAYIRWVNEQVKITDLFRDVKKIIIYATGVRALKRLLKQHGIPHNESFAGIYAFSKAKHYGQFFPQFLREVGNKGILMCHPGLPSDSKEDAIAAARYEEYQYLASKQFLADCENEAITLGRFA